MPSWFDTARFGMFVHWSHSSQQGIEVSWPLVGGVFALAQGAAVPVEEYHATAATFDPRSYEPGEWARMAKNAGMQYAVFTTKHHDGYAMFDTKTVSEYGVMHSPCGRDLFREFADAMRAEGIRVGAYFSLIDWHHPDYPAFTQDDAPYKFPVGKPADPERWPRFIDVMFEQIRELLTNYGRIDVIWFDGGWERSIPQWRSKELEALIRSLQPEILINDRLPGVGDYATPEQFIPPRPPAHGLRRATAEPTGAWETCMTMNESWGYNPRDTHWKSARRLIHSLCEVAGRGGNLLLNVGPDGEGRLPVEQRERLAAFERWMSVNGESILGTTPGLDPWQFYGPSTKKDGVVYLHLLMRPYESVTVRGVKVKRVRSVRLVGTGAGLQYASRTTIGDMLANPDPNGELTITVPEHAIDEYVTVIAIEFADAPV